MKSYWLKVLDVTAMHSAKDLQLLILSFTTHAQKAKAVYRAAAEAKTEPAKDR